MQTPEELCNQRTDDRVARIRSAHPWLSDDMACKLLIGNYLQYHMQAGTRIADGSIHQSMEKYTDFLCAKSDKDLKGLLANIEERWLK